MQEPERPDFADIDEFSAEVGIAMSRFCDIWIELGSCVGW
jgi:hypothetical protein